MDIRFKCVYESHIDEGITKFYYSVEVRAVKACVLTARLVTLRQELGEARDYKTRKYWFIDLSMSTDITVKAHITHI